MAWLALYGGPTIPRATVYWTGDAPWWTPEQANAFAMMMVRMGDADGMLCGTFGTHAMHLHYVDQVIGLPVQFEQADAENLPFPTVPSTR